MKREDVIPLEPGDRIRAFTPLLLVPKLDPGYAQHRTVRADVKGDRDPLLSESIPAEVAEALNVPQDEPSRYVDFPVPD